MIAPAHPNRHPLPPRRSLIEHPESNGFDSRDSDRTQAGGPRAIVQRVVAKHPVVAVTVAGLVGITIGCLVKRRGQ